VERLAVVLLQSVVALIACQIRQRALSKRMAATVLLDMRLLIVPGARLVGPNPRYLYRVIQVSIPLVEEVRIAIN